MRKMSHSETNLPNTSCAGSGNKNKKALRNVREVKRVAHGTTDKDRKVGA